MDYDLLLAHVKDLSNDELRRLAHIVTELRIANAAADNAAPDRRGVFKAKVEAEINLAAFLHGMVIERRMS